MTALWWLFALVLAALVIYFLAPGGNRMPVDNQGAGDQPKPDQQGSVGTQLNQTGPTVNRTQGANPTGPTVSPAVSDYPKGEGAVENPAFAHGDGMAVAGDRMGDGEAPGNNFWAKPPENSTAGNKQGPTNYTPPPKVNDQPNGGQLTNTATDAVQGTGPTNLTGQGMGVGMGDPGGINAAGAPGLLSSVTASGNGSTLGFGAAQDPGEGKPDKLADEQQLNDGGTGYLNP